MKGMLKGLVLAGLLVLSAMLPVHAVKSSAKPEEKPAAKPWQPARVVSVIDGDTFVISTGERVRLLDINTPELGHNGVPDEPYAVTATRVLKSWVNNQNVWLQTGKRERDDYGRLLAHVYVADGSGGYTWVNGTMVKVGAAVVYSFAENATYADKLLAYENAARQNKKGLWSLPRWNVKQAGTCCTADAIGLFQLVEGKVQTSGQSRDALYLNFGSDYRTDFTIIIPRKYFKNFGGSKKERNAKAIEAAYVGKTVRVHGVLAPVNGVQVRVTHPAQIEILGK